MTGSAVRETRIYTIRNIDQKAKTLVVEHGVRPGYELIGVKPSETGESHLEQIASKKRAIVENEQELKHVQDESNELITDQGRLRQNHRQPQSRIRAAGTSATVRARSGRHRSEDRRIAGSAPLAGAEKTQLDRELSALIETAEF